MVCPCALIWLDEGFVVGIAGQHVELRLFRHLADARRAGQGDVLRGRKAFNLSLAAVWSLTSIAPKSLTCCYLTSLRLVAGIHFEESALGRLFVESGIGIVRAERERCERKRSASASSR